MREEIIELLGKEKRALSASEICDKLNLNTAGELKKLLDDVDKIKDVENYDTDKLIAPWQKDAILREDVENEMLDAKEVLKNAPKHSGNYIEVPIVISEEV